MRAGKNTCSHCATKIGSITSKRSPLSLNTTKHTYVTTLRQDITSKLFPDCCVANRFISAWAKSSFIPLGHCLQSLAHFKPCIHIKRRTGSKLHASTCRSVRYVYDACTPSTYKSLSWYIHTNINNV